MFRCNRLLLSLFIAACGLKVSIAAEGQASDKAEARQLVEDATPQAQYRTSQKEANAAYQEALAECRRLREVERANCIKDARSNLQNDLAEARKTLSSGQ